MINVQKATVSGVLVAVLAGCGGSGNEETAQKPSNDGAAVGTTTAAPVADRARVASRPTEAAVAAPPAADPTADPAAAPVAVPSVPARPPVITFTLASTGLPEDGMWKCDPIFADFNDDGHLDLAALPRLGDGPRVWLGDGKGVWTDSSSGLRRQRKSCGGGLDVGDLNNDGNLDIAVADHCDGVYVYLGNGRGDWIMATKALYPTDIIQDPGKLRNFQGAEDIAVGDVNGDGNLDLAVGGSDDGGINVYLGDGTGVNWTRSACALPTVGWCVRVLLEDINDDQLLDVVAAHSDGPRVWINDGDGDWKPWFDGMPSPVVTGLFTGIAVGDINEDGRQDIAVANWVDGPEVYLQQEGGFWFQTPDVFPKMLGGAIGLDLGDLDRDGHLDIVTSGRLELDGGYVRGVFALLGNGVGSWTYEENTGLPSTGLMTTPGVALGDVNGDGILDVAAASGLIIESNTGAPAIPNRMMVWTTQIPDTKGASVDAGSEDN